jgi:hypothetical protein
MGESDNVEQIRTGKEEIVKTEREHGHMLSEKVHAIALWFLIVALLGASAGIGLAFKYHSNQLDKTVQIGSFVHKHVVYEVRPRGLK